MRERLFLFLFGGAFAAVGIGMSSWAGITISLWIRSASWQSVPATISELRMEHNDGTERVLCNYSYTFNGRRYTGNRPSMYNASDNFGSFHADLYNRLSGDRDADTATCLVDPSQPDRSLLDRTFRPGMLAVQLIFAVAFGTIGLAVLAFYLGTREPREVDDRLQIDSSHRPARITASVLMLYHGLIVLAVVPVCLYCLLAGDFSALVPMLIVGASIAALYFCYKHNFKSHPVLGKLRLPDRHARQKHMATLRLPAGWEGPVDMELRWVIPAPPTNRVGVEDETGIPSHVQLPYTEQPIGASEFDLPIPEFPEHLPINDEIKLELMGTIGDRKYNDEFTLDDDAIDWLRAESKP